MPDYRPGVGSDIDMCIKAHFWTSDSEIGLEIKN